MAVGAKHLATFLLGAVAGLAAQKYMSMTDEEKEKLLADLKAKAKAFKDEAETAADRASDYFQELKTKSSSEFKENFKEVESLFNDLFGKKTGNPPA